MSSGGAAQNTIAWRCNNAGQRENIRDNSSAIEYIDNDLGRLYTELNSFIDSECGAPPCPAYSTPNMPAVEIYRSYDNFGFAATLGDNYGRSGGTTSRVVEYTYDAFDRLVKRAADTTSPFNMADAVVEQMVYDGQNVALKFNGTTSPTVTRYLHGQAVDQVLAEEQPNNWGTANRTYWTLADHLGTVRDIANQAGVLKDHIAFDAFGKLTSETSTSINVPYGFTGFWYDRDTKLNFSETRAYDAGTGTWQQEDWIGFDGGDTNLGRYVDNSPVNYVDPTGEGKVMIGVKAIWRGAYYGLKDKVKEAGLSAFLHVHHKITQEIFDKDTALGPFLKGLGFAKNDSTNVIILPTKLGKACGYGTKRSLHEGSHIAAYVEDVVRARLTEIHQEHILMVKKEGAAAADAKAQERILAFQLELQEGLKNGKIALQKSDWEALEGGTALSVAGIGTIMGEAVQLNDNGIKILDIGKIQHYTGEEGVLGYAGWFADMANPAADYADVCYLVDDAKDVVVEVVIDAQGVVQHNATLNRFKDPVFDEDENVQAVRATGETPVEPSSKGNKKADRAEREAEEQRERERAEIKKSGWWGSLFWFDLKGVFKGHPVPDD